MKTIAVAGLAGAVLFGTAVLAMGVGYTAADGVPDTKTVTKTRTVEVPVEKRVEVKVPVTKEVEVPVTKRVEVEVTPEACLRAISAAEDMGHQAGEFADITAQYPPLVSRAYDAGLTQDLQKAQQVLDKMDSLLGDLKRVNGQVDEVVADFNQAKVDC